MQPYEREKRERGKKVVRAGEQLISSADAFSLS
jgi:hypothetical protein